MLTALCKGTTVSLVLDWSVVIFVSARCSGGAHRVGAAFTPRKDRDRLRSHFGSSHFGSSHLRSEPATSRHLLLVSVMVAGKDPSVLSAALNGIASASLAARDKLLLQKHAVQIFMAEMAPAPAVRGVCTEAIDDVAALYAVLSEAAGVRISRPTAAVAFVKVLGLDCFTKRISKLSSRRNHAAHPDPGFIDDISAAIHGLGPAALAALSASFRCRMKHDDAADEHLVHDSETGQHILADTKVDGPLTLHQPSAQATDRTVHTRALMQGVPGLQQDPRQHDMQPKVQPDGQPTAIPAANMSAGKYLNLADLPLVSAARHRRTTRSW